MSLVKKSKVTTAMRKCENIVKIGFTILTIVCGSVNSTKLNNWPTFFFYFAIYSDTASFVCYCINRAFNVHMDKFALFVKAYLIYFTFQVSSIQTWLFSDGAFTCTLQIVKVRYPLFYFRLFREEIFFLFLASTNKAGSCIEEMFEMFHYVSSSYAAAQWNLSSHVVFSVFPFPTFTHFIGLTGVCLFCVWNEHTDAVWYEA